MIKNILFLVPAIVGAVGIEPSDSSVPVNLIYESNFDSTYPGTVSKTTVYCDIDECNETLYRFRDGKALIVGKDKFHDVLEVFNNDGMEHFNCISGTLYSRFYSVIDVSRGSSNSNLIEPCSKGGELDPNTESFGLDHLQEHLNTYFYGVKADDDAVFKHDIPLPEIIDIPGQYALSCYKFAQKWSESNCELSAGYAAMRYLINDNGKYMHQFSSFPKKTQRRYYYPESEEKETYDLVRSKGYDYKTYPLIFETAYATMRTKALSISKDFVLGGGLNPGDQSRMLELFASEYGMNSFNSYEVFNYNAEMGKDRFREFIDADIPLMWGTTGGQHGTHVMTVFGYKFYKHSVKNFFGFPKDVWRTILKVFDGEGSSYFDITQYFSFVNHGGCILEYVWDGKDNI